jgi:hypothetical protein
MGQAGRAVAALSGCLSFLLSLPLLHKPCLPD